MRLAARGRQWFARTRRALARGAGALRAMLPRGWLAVAAALLLLASLLPATAPALPAEPATAPAAAHGLSSFSAFAGFSSAISASLVSSSAFTKNFAVGGSGNLGLVLVFALLALLTLLEVGGAVDGQRHGQ